MVQHAMQSSVHAPDERPLSVAAIVLIDNIMTYDAQWYDVQAMASCAMSLSILVDFLAQFISIRWSDFIWGSSASRRH